MTLEGIALILQRITAHDIKCDLKFGVLTAARKPRHEAALKRERDAWEKLGHTDMEYLPKSRVQKLVSAKQYLGGLLDPKGAHFHPLNYALGVAQAAQKLGCKLHDDTYATQIVMQPAPKVITAEGTVNAKFIIIAGSVKIPGIIGNLQAKTLTTTAHMISTEPMDSTRARNLIPGDIAVGDARHFMDYYRFSGNHCLLFGGTHNYTGWESGSEDQALRKRMLSLFPSLGTTRIDHFWSTPMEFTFDRLPHIGKLSPQVFYAHGFGGHGLIAANVAGKVLAEAVSGTAEKFDVFAKIQHLTIPGGACVKRPLFLLMAAWHRVMDILP